MDRSISVSITYILCQAGLILFMYPTNIIGSTTESHWMPILLGVLVHFLMVWVLLMGLGAFPNQDMIAIFRQHGRGVAILLLTPVFAYLFMGGVIAVRSYAEIVTIIFLSETPSWAIMTLLLTLATYLASKGIESILRTGVIMFLLFIPLLCFILVASFQNADWRYIHPFFSKDFSFLKSMSYFNSYFAIGGVFVLFGFLQPIVTFTKKSIFLSSLCIVPVFFVSVYVPILTFGQDTSSQFIFPFVIAVDAVNLTWFMFDRLTMFFLLSIVIFILIFLSLVLWMLVILLKRSVCQRVSSTYVLLGLSVCVLTLCFFIPDWNAIDTLFTWNTPLRFFVLIIVPVSVFLLGIRAKRKESV